MFIQSRGDVKGKRRIAVRSVALSGWHLQLLELDPSLNWIPRHERARAAGTSDTHILMERLFVPPHLPFVTAALDASRRTAWAAPLHTRFA
jgi:hypothetical protein